MPYNFTLFPDRKVISKPLVKPPLSGPAEIHIYTDADYAELLGRR